MPTDVAQPHSCLLRELRARFGPEVTEGSAIAQEDVMVRLLEELKPRRILEIGTRHGISAALFARHAETVTTVDIEKSPVSFRKLARDVWASCDVAHKITPYLAPGEVGWQYNAAKASFIASQDFDFAFIDGSHHWRDVLFDLRCVRRCGCVLFHDYKPEGGAYADCDNERYQGIADVIDGLSPAAYLLGKHCSQMALWLADDHPARQRAADFLSSLPRPARGRWSAMFSLARRRLERRLERFGHSLRKRLGGSRRGDS
ncbi:MAG: class I SAM-dependent methyltransferase [Verrucomicrobiales bacterium]